MLDRKIIAARLRQLLAADKNACAIYSELAQLTDKDALRTVFLGLSKEEARHSKLDEEMLLLLEE
jgi:rubrerythrin